MSKKAVIQRITTEKVFAVLRIQRTERILDIVGALSRGEISIVEVTLNSRNALDVIEQLSRECPDCLVGAGTVIGYDASVQAVERGAKFLVSPVTDLDMLAVASQLNVTSMAGALTPTEAWQAAQAGADFVKVFPLTGLGAPYIKALRGPLSDIRFIPTNGVTPENARDFIDAGAVAVGVGTPLVSDADLEQSDLSVIEQRARTLTQSLRSPS